MLCRTSKRNSCNFTVTRHPLRPTSLSNPQTGFVIHVSLKLHKCRKFNGGRLAEFIRSKESQPARKFILPHRLSLLGRTLSLRVCSSASLLRDADCGTCRGISVQARPDTTKSVEAANFGRGINGGLLASEQTTTRGSGGEPVNLCRTANSPNLPSKYGLQTFAI